MDPQSVTTVQRWPYRGVTVQPAENIKNAAVRSTVFKVATADGRQDISVGVDIWRKPREDEQAVDGEFDFDLMGVKCSYSKLLYVDYVLYTI